MICCKRENIDLLHKDFMSGVPYIADCVNIKFDTLNSISNYRWYITVRVQSSILLIDINNIKQVFERCLKMNSKLLLCCTSNKSAQ